jgi:hypothetical protein
VLAFQGVVFKGLNESVGPKNREIFFETLDLTDSYNEEIAD